MEYGNLNNDVCIDSVVEKPQESKTNIAISSELVFINGISILTKLMFVIFISYTTFLFVKRY